jgi:UDP-N-acetylmuramoyl-L-alanyl-D-glutamate--2,6-diaminopimelate ligase
MRGGQGVRIPESGWREALGVPVPRGWPAVVFGVCADSRQVRPGYVFVAVKGLRQDGHGFLQDAIARGAVAVVAEDAVTCAVPCVRVPDARIALAHACSTFFGHPARALRVTGITGTNGKTTVAFFLRQLLEAAGHPCGLLGTVHHSFGQREIPARQTTPGAPELHGLFASMREAGCGDCVMEVSSHAIDQDRVEGIPFAAAIFTNLSQDHLDYHRDMESYFQTKARLFAWESLRVRVAGEDAWSLRLTRERPGPWITCGLGEACAVRAVEARHDADGTSARLFSPWGEAEIRLPFPGEHNLRNALQSLAAACALGVPLATLLPVLPTLRPAPGRLEAVPCPVGRIYVDYAHTPDALARVLRALRPLAGGRLIVLFGCGGERDRGKRPLMAAEAAALADHLILTQDNPRGEDPQKIFDDMLAGLPPGAPAEVLPDRAAAIAHGVGLLAEGDLFLIAGKGHESEQKFAHHTVPFDDREVARDAVARRFAAPRGGSR